MRPVMGPPGASFSPPSGSLSSSSLTDKRMAKIDRNTVDPQIRKAAEGMEGMFLDYMMKVMRETVPKNDLDLENPATEIYRSMLDSEIAQKAVHSGGVGLADQIIAYLQTERYNLKQGQPEAPQARASAARPAANAAVSSAVNTAVDTAVNHGTGGTPNE